MKEDYNIKVFESILAEISDILEGGDIVEDFENNPYAVGIIRSLNSIVGNELRAIRATKELLKNMEELKWN